MTDDELARCFEDLQPLGRKPSAGPRYPVGDCHVGDCQRPADHAGKHGLPTKRELAALQRRPN